MVKKTMVLIGTISWVLLPKCSLCLYAYISIFSALGLGNIIYNKHTVFYLSIFLLVNFITVLIMLLREKEYSYAIISFIGALFFVCNKFYLDNNIYITIFISSILIVALIRIRVLYVLSRRCLFSGH